MAIEVLGVRKTFRRSADTTQVLDGISLRVDDGRVIVLFGPNGSGKSTLLNIVAGIETADAGTVTVSAAADRPRTGYALQQFSRSLMPWLTALENCAFALIAAGVHRDQALATAGLFLDEFDVPVPREKYAYQLSGGQQQMVAIARTLVARPQNLLLDEPFSALDHRTRFRMQHVVTETARRSNSAMLAISHDLDEALSLADELILLSHRPARIIERFDVPFTRPRSPQLLASAEFVALRTHTLRRFLTEVVS